MKLAAPLVCLLLSACSAAAAATPDALWQEYQKHPSYVSTQPRAAAPAPTPHVTVEDAEGRASEPTTPQQAKEKAEVTRQTEAADGKSQTQAAAATTKTEQTQPARNADKQEQATTAPTVSAAPQAAAPRPKILPSLVKKPPLPRQYLRTPQASDFAAAASEAGGYSLLLPTAFGGDPLAQLPLAQGAMLVRAAGNTLMCAATVLDPTDTVSYQAQHPLPAYDGKKLYASWQHGADLIWDCSLSRHNDFYGDKLLLKAEAQQDGKTYQLLYVMPLAQLRVYLPQALYSLDSFKLQTAE